MKNTKDGMISEHDEQTIYFYFMTIQLIKYNEELSFLTFADVDVEEEVEAEDGNPRTEEDNPGM